MDNLRQGARQRNASGDCSTSRKTSRIRRDKAQKVDMGTTRDAGNAIRVFSGWDGETLLVDGTSTSRPIRSSKLSVSR